MFKFIFSCVLYYVLYIYTYLIIGTYLNIKTVIYQELIMNFAVTFVRKNNKIH